MLQTDPSSPVVLIVEDDLDIRQTLGEILDDEGYTPVEVGDGREALQWLRRNPAPRAILLDLMMPVMSGWEFRTAQRRDPVLKDIPVLVVSGAGDVRSETERLHAAGCIPKPIDIVELLAALRDLC